MTGATVAASNDRVDERPGSPGAALLGYVGIEAAARAVGVSPSALRLWERQGLIAPVRTPGGTRRYRPEDLVRLHAVRRWRTVDGLNAAAIRRLLEAARSEAPAPTGPSEHAPARPGGRPARTPARPEPRSTIAERLRSLRRERGLTLRAAAGRSGLSTSFISALERGMTGASIAALRRLVHAYGATLAGLLGEPTRDDGRLVCAEDRRVLDTGDGVRIENLANGPTLLEPQLFVLEPGASSQGAYSHPGEEFMFVLSGSLAVWLGETEVYRLEAGDALTFPSTLVHRFLALGPSDTRLIWVNTPPTF